MKPAPEIRSLLPLTESTLYILLSLSPGPRHGYAIMKDVQALSDGRLHLSTGTLYGALKRMLEQGWIDRAPLAAGQTSGRIRKAYALTELGREVMGAEISRMEALLKVAALQSARAGI